MSEQPPSPTLSVMLVEDDEDVRELTAMVLSRHGYRVHPVATVGEACAELDAHTPSVLICDLSLADGSGLDVARHALREGRRRPCLLIALTGHVQPQNREDSRSAGFHHHLAKPVAIAELCRLIEESVARP